MTKQLKTVSVLASALDESELRGGTIILRGVIDKDSLKHLSIDDYQREALPISSLSGLMAAIKNGDALPDIEIGMRGDRCSGRGEAHMLSDACYIIDGQQRVNAALNVLAQDPDASIRLGAMIHFNTTREWEMERFRILNALRAKVSPNVLLRNAREKHPSVASLYGLSTNDKTFALYNKVSWAQAMKRGDLVSALVLIKTTLRLHSHKSAGKGSQLSELTRMMDQLGSVVGNGNVRTNVKTFFDAVDECWGIKLVHYKEMAPHLRSTFLMTLARVFSEHLDFWSDDESKKLFVPVDLKRKLRTFPMNDPAVMGLLSGGGGKATSVLFNLIVEHMNKGKRTGHLKARCPTPVMLEDDDTSEAA